MMKVWTVLLAWSVVLLSFISFATASDHQQAIAYFNKACRLQGDPNDAVVLSTKEKLYKKAIELWPEFPEAHNNLGDVYERQGRFEEAIAEYKKAIKFAPKTAYPYFGLGDVYFKTGQYKKAMIWYKKGLKYDSNDQVTLRRVHAIKEIIKSKMIKARTIVEILSHTRGVRDEVSITFGETLIPFDFNEYKIREDAKAQLNELGKALREMFFSTQAIAGVEYDKREERHFLIEIAGHTDIRGSDEYNLWLSRMRAKAVADYLVRNFGIPRDRLLVRGYGEQRPICPEGASEIKETPCNALNRRVEIIKHILHTHH